MNLTTHNIVVNMLRANPLLLKSSSPYYSINGASYPIWMQLVAGRTYSASTALDDLADILGLPLRDIAWLHRSDVTLQQLIDLPLHYDFVDGYNHFGRDKNGRDREDYDKAGYNKDNRDRLEYDLDGYDKQGLDRLGNPKPTEDADE